MRGAYERVIVRDGKVVEAEEIVSILNSLQSPNASDERILFPVHLRKMWCGSEVQAWLDERMGITPPRQTAKGSLERYRQWQAAQAVPSPDVDAIEQKPCAYRRWDEGNSRWFFTLWPEEEQQFEWSPVYAAPVTASGVTE